MKKITALLFFCMMAFMGYAGPVSRGQALEIAKAYLQNNRVARGLSGSPQELSLAYECVSKSVRGAVDTQPLYYVFNHGKQDGFLVVAADDRMTPVLAVVDQGRFDITTVHDNLKWWLQAMEATMADVVQTQGDFAGPVIADETLKPFVEPLVKVKWGQGAPYNDKCPYDSVHAQRSLVGCTAVAMAQVLSKWKSPAQGNGQVDYVTSTHKMTLSEDLSTFNFDWDKMLPDYVNCKGTQEEIDAVATLMYACGVSVKMNYCAIASGAFLLSSDFEEHFSLAPTCNDVERLYFTRSEWDHLMKSELSAGRPVVYNGFSMSAGHSFVCDGYNADGLFHINWGWDGSLNGYFALAELNSAVEYAGAPTDNDGSFNLDQNVVYGIQPADCSDVEAGEMLYFSEMKDCKVSAKTNVMVHLKTVRADGNGFVGDFGLGVYDANGDFVCCVGQTAEASLLPGYYYENVALSGNLPKGLEDGNYTLRPVFQQKNGDYVPMRGRKGSGYVTYMNLSLRHGNAFLGEPRDIDAKLSIVSAKAIGEKVYSGTKNVLEITLRNDGAMYNGPIQLVRNEGGRNYSIYDNNYILEKGETKTILVKVLAPEGVDKDSLSVWVAQHDADLHYINGYHESVIGSFTYKLIKTTPGVPKIKVDWLTINNKDAHAESHLDVDLQISNQGGFYGEHLYCHIYPKTGGSSLGVGSTEIKLDKGDTLHLNVQIPIKDLDDGDYFLLPYIIYGGSWVELTSTRYYFSKRTNGWLKTNKEGYAVYCFDYAIDVPAGVECGVVTAADTTGMKIEYRYVEGDVIPSATSFILKAASRKSYKYQIIDCEELAPKDNLLSAQIDEKGHTYAGEGDYLYYRFFHNGEGVLYGFYLSNNEGAPYTLPKEKCYLALPRESARLSGYPFDADLTAVQNVVLEQENLQNAEIYTLNGVRTFVPFHALPKGLYIVNGKKRMK